MSESKTNFKKLRQEWYAKLKAEGFNDIETLAGDLKEFSTSGSRNIKKVLTQSGGWQFKQEYYRLASKFLNEYKFNTKLDSIIWEYHTNGISVRNIAKALIEINVKTNRTDVWKVVKRLKIKMFDMYLVKVQPRHE